MRTSLNLIRVGSWIGSNRGRPGEGIRKFPELFLWFIFTYLPLLFLWFIFTIVGPEKWEGQNGQPKEEHLRC